MDKIWIKETFNAIVQNVVKRMTEQDGLNDKLNDTEDEIRSLCNLLSFNADKQDRNACRKNLTFIEEALETLEERIRDAHIAVAQNVAMFGLLDELEG